MRESDLSGNCVACCRTHNKCLIFIPPCVFPNFFNAVLFLPPVFEPALWPSNNMNMCCLWFLLSSYIYKYNPGSDALQKKTWKITYATPLRWLSHRKNDKNVINIRMIYVELQKLLIRILLENLKEKNAIEVIVFSVSYKADSN